MDLAHLICIPAEGDDLPFCTQISAKWPQRLFPARLSSLRKSAQPRRVSAGSQRHHSASQFPEAVRRDFASLCARQVNHKFLYDNVKQTQKWQRRCQALLPSRDPIASKFGTPFTAASRPPNLTRSRHRCGLRRRKDYAVAKQLSIWKSSCIRCRTAWCWWPVSSIIIVANCLRSCRLACRGFATILQKRPARSRS